MLSDRIKQHKILIFLTLFSIWFAFNSAKNWLQDGCIVTAADFEFFRTTGHLIHAQLLEYRSLFPISFENIHGAGAFVYSCTAFLIPLIFTPLISYESSLLITYILFYALIPPTMYILLKNTTKNEFVSLLIPLCLLISSALNTTYTVYGVYHTIIALPFFFLAINSIIQYEKNKNKKNIIQFSVFSFLVGTMHIYTFMFYFIFAASYLLIKKEKKLLIILLLIATSVAYYYVPLGGQYMLRTENTPSVKNGDIVKNFNALFFEKYTTYTPDMDLNYRSDLFIGALLSILIFSIKREQNSNYKISTTQLKLNIPSYMIMLSLVILVMISLFGYVSLFTQVSLERYGLFAQISFMLIIGAALSKTRINLPIYLTISLLLILLSPDNTRIVAALIIPAIYLILSYAIPAFDKDIRNNIDIHKIRIKDTIISSVLIILLFYSQTSLVITSNTSPRYWCSTMPHISEIITEKDIYHDAIESHTALSTFTKAKRAVGIGAMTYHNAADLTLDDNHTYELLKKEEATKIIIAIYSNDWQQKYAHLFRWFGEPAIIQGTRRDQPQYYLLFSTGFTNERDYDMKIITPTTLEITKKPEVDEQFIHLSYHPWWKIDNSKATLEKDQDGFTIIMNSKGISNLTITWNYTYFYIGWIITIISIMLLVYIIIKTPKTHEIIDSDQSSDKNIKKKHLKRSQRKQ